MAAVAVSKRLPVLKQTGHLIKTSICGAAISSPNTNIQLEFCAEFYFCAGECLEVLNILINDIFKKICSY